MALANKNMKEHNEKECALNFGKDCPNQRKCWKDCGKGNLNPNRVPALDGSGRS
jgi:hypothetical protein